MFLNSHQHREVFYYLTPRNNEWICIYVYLKKTSKQINSDPFTKIISSSNYISINNKWNGSIKRNAARGNPGLICVISEYKHAVHSCDLWYMYTIYLCIYILRVYTWHICGEDEMQKQNKGGYAHPFVQFA